MTVPYRWSADWPRMVAGELNRVTTGYPFPSLATAPTSVEAGYTYYDTALNTVRTWTGAAWANHF